MENIQRNIQISQNFTSQAPETCQNNIFNEHNKVKMRVSFKTTKKIIKSSNINNINCVWESSIPVVSILKYKYAKNTRITRLLLFAISVNELMILTLTFFEYLGQIDDTILVFEAFFALPISWVLNYIVGSGLWAAQYHFKYIFPFFLLIDLGGKN